MPLRLSLALAVVVAAAAVSRLGVGLLGPVATLLLLVGLAGGLAYSLPPVAAMRRGWGEVLNTLLGALALPLFGVAVVRGRIDPLDAVAFLPFAAVTLCSVMATAWPDRAADAATGKRTLQVRWPAGPAAAAPCLDRGRLAGRHRPGRRDGRRARPGRPSPACWCCRSWSWARVRYTRRDDPWPSVAAMVGHIAVTAGALALVVA